MSVVFSCPPRLYAHAKVRRVLMRYAWVAAAAALGLGAAAFADTRFVYALLIVLLVAYPMIFSMVWIVITGRPDFVRATRPQRWTFRPDGSAEIEFFRFSATETDPGEPVDIQQIVPDNIERIELRKGYTFVWLRRMSTPLIVPTRLTPASV